MSQELQAALAEAFGLLGRALHEEEAASAEARSLVFCCLLVAMAEARGRVVPSDPRGWVPAWRVDAAPPPPWASELAPALSDRFRDLALLEGLPAEMVVAAYEASLRGRESVPPGAFYTPPAVVEGLLDLGLEPSLREAPTAAALQGLRVCDPSCGAGAFLLAAQRRLEDALVARGLDRPRARAVVARDVLHGVDLDPAAVALCRGLAWLQAELPWEDLPTLRGFQVGHSLLGALPGGFDVVVGNPPFLGQLRTSSARSRALRELLRARFDGLVRGYADTAVAFALLGLELLRPGGRCTLVLPVSFLASRDAAAARRHLAERCGLEAMWLATEHVFPGASVFVCAPTLRLGGPRRTRLHRRRGLPFQAVPPLEVDMDEVAAAPTWSPLLAAAAGIPEVQVGGPRTVGDEAEVLADFRDQYYGLRGFVVEDADLPPGADPADWPALVTTGLVDPARCRWGTSPTRFDKARWQAPRVDLSRLEREGSIGAWARARLVPKVLLATQTRVLEPVVDEQGSWVPLIPLISVVPRAPGRAWHLAAALCSPPLTALAASRWLGTALSLSAIKLSAGQVRTLPLPAPGPAWDEAARAFRLAQHEPDRRAEHLLRCGAHMNAAYGRPDDAALLEWWARRAGLLTGTSPAPPAA